MSSFFGGGGAADLASPSAIGSTTPNTGAFTTLSFAPPANTIGLSSSSYSLTGSNAQSLVSLSGTWNTTGTPVGILLNLTDTASNASSSLVDLQIGGTSRFKISKNGMIIARESTTASQATIAADTGGNYGIGYSNGGFFFRANGTIIGGFGLHGGTSILSMALGASHYIGWQSGTWAGNTSPDLRLFRDAANTLAQRNSTNAQTFRLYRTYTDASNYERLALSSTGTTRFSILAEKAGTGADRQIEISFYTSASDPTSTDITDGCTGVWKNSGTGTIKVWANDGGTMKSVALA